MEWILYGLIALMVVGIAAAIVDNRRQRSLAEKLAVANTIKAEAKSAYQSAIDELRADPNNPAKRQAALTKGRTYSDLNRDQQGVTVYDEVAIKNDLDAATAGAATTAGPPPTS